MNKAFNNFTWHNEPSIASPLNASNLNKVNNGLDTVDNRVIILDSDKANQSDLLQSLKTITYNSTTGVFVFTWWNGNTLTVDLNIEKIPVSFSMSPQGVISMQTADGTVYTADVAELIKTYTFNTSTDIRFDVTIDTSGNRTILAYIVDGSITASKLDPDYLAQIVLQVQNAVASADAAALSANNAAADALLSKSYAIGNSGIRTGEDTDNAKYYKEKADEYQQDAKLYRDQAQAIVGISIATTTTAGIVKPDGETISVAADGTIAAEGVTDAVFAQMQTILGTDV